MAVRPIREDEEVVEEASTPRMEPMPGPQGATATEPSPTPRRTPQLRPLREGEEVVTDTEEPSFLSQVGEQANRAAQSFNQGLLEPFGLSGVASRVGITPKEGEAPEGIVASAFRGAGEAAGIAGAMVAPYLRAPKLMMSSQQFLSSLAGRTPGIAESVRQGVSEIARTAASRPASFFGAEALLGAGSGAGGEVAEQQFPDSPVARAFGELAGGVGTAATGAGVRRAIDIIPRIAPVAIATRGAVNLMRGRPLASGGQRAAERAAGRINRATDRSDESLLAADQADVLPEARSRMTIGEQAEDPGLLELERSVMESTSTLSRANQERFAELNEMLRRSTQEAADAGDATPEQMREYLDGLIASRLEIATQRAQERLSELGPDVGREQANRLAREEIERAYRAAKEQENALWEAVPEDTEVPMTATIETVKQRLKNAARNRVAAERRGDLPASITRFIGRFDEQGEWQPGKLGEVTTAGELKELRTDVLDALRRERAKPAPNNRRIAALSQVQSALLEDASQASPGPDSPLAMARGFSRDLNERFQRGDVGRILGFDVQGGERIAPGMTLESTVGRSSAAARESVDALQRAVERSGDQPAMREHIENFLTDEFLRASRRDGDFDPQAASRFLEQRQDVLARFPELRRRLQGAVQSGEAVRDVQRLSDPKVSAAAVVLNSPPGQELQRIIRSRDPAQAARETKNLLAEAGGERAVSGMRRAFTDLLLQRSEGRALDAQDRPMLEGRRMQELLSDQRVQEVANVILTPEQLGRLNQIRNTALRLDRSRRAPQSEEGVMGDRRGIISDFANRYLFAQGGSFLARRSPGGANIQTPGFAVKLGRRLQEMGIDPARKLLVDAVTSDDPKLMRTLMLTAEGSPRRQDMVRRRLNAWALTSARELGIDLGGEDEQTTPREQEGTPNAAQ